MTGLSLLPIFLIGLMGSVHCIGMCGGIVSAFSAAGPQRGRLVPVRVVRAGTSGGAGGTVGTVGTRGGSACNGGAEMARAAPEAFADNLLRVMSYNIGRIVSYMVAGALAGALAGGIQTLVNLNTLQMAGWWLANLMLIALGLHLMDAWRGLSRLEALGQHVWRRVQPLMKHLLPVDTPIKAVALGALWGWVPCAMVYSVLATAMLTGSAVQGASVMLAFGLGTLPTLMTMGMLGERLRDLARDSRVRTIAGLIVLAFGMLGLWRAGHGITPAWLDLFCIVPPPGVHR